MVDGAARPGGGGTERSGPIRPSRCRGCPRSASRTGKLATVARPAPRRPRGRHASDSRTADGPARYPPLAGGVEDGRLPAGKRARPHRRRGPGRADAGSSGVPARNAQAAAAGGGRRLRHPSYRPLRRQAHHRRAPGAITPGRDGARTAIRLVPGLRAGDAGAWRHPEQRGPAVGQRSSPSPAGLARGQRGHCRHHPGRRPAAGGHPTPTHHPGRIDQDAGEPAPGRPEQPGGHRPDEPRPPAGPPAGQRRRADAATAAGLRHAGSAQSARGPGATCPRAAHRSGPLADRDRQRSARQPRGDRAASGRHRGRQGLAALAARAGDRAAGVAEQLPRRGGPGGPVDQGLAAGRPARAGPARRAGALPSPPAPPIQPRGPRSSRSIAAPAISSPARVPASARNSTASACAASIACWRTCSTRTATSIRPFA